MEKTFGKKNKELNKQFGNTSDFEVAQRISNTAEDILEYLLNNFNKTLKTKDEHDNFFKFESNCKDLNKKGLGISIGIYRNLKKIFPNHKLFKNSSKVMSNLQKINNIRTLKLAHGGKDKEEVEVDDVVDMLNYLNDIVKDLGILNEPKFYDFSLFNYLWYKSIIEISEKKEQKKNFKIYGNEIILDSDELIPKILKELLFNLYTSLKLSSKEKLLELEYYSIDDLDNFYELFDKVNIELNIIGKKDEERIKIKKIENKIGEIKKQIKRIKEFKDEEEDFTIKDLYNYIRLLKRVYDILLVGIDKEELRYINRVKTFYLNDKQIDSEEEKKLNTLFIEEKIIDKNTADILKLEVVNTLKGIDHNTINLLSDRKDDENTLNFKSDKISDKDFNKIKKLYNKGRSVEDIADIYDEINLETIKEILKDELEESNSSKKPQVLEEVNNTEAKLETEKAENEAKLKAEALEREERLAEEAEILRVEQEEAEKKAILEEENADVIDSETQKILDKLGNLSGDERWEIARSLDTSIHILKKLAKDEDEDVRRTVAKNPNTPYYILEVLADDESEEVREEVVWNNNVSVKILEKLSNDEDYTIRMTVAKNIKTPIHILEKLAKDDSEYVRAKVIWNPNISTNLFNILYDDSSEVVQIESRIKLASSPGSSVNILEELSDFEDDMVKKSVAKNIKTPVHVLEKLAENGDWEIKRAVAENKKTPTNILESLVLIGTHTVRRAILFNDNCTNSVLNKLYFNNPDKNSKKRNEIQLYILQNSSLSKAMIEDAQSKSYMFKKALASNNTTPINILNELLNDSSKQVQDAALKNLENQAKDKPESGELSASTVDESLFDIETKIKFEEKLKSFRELSGDEKNFRVIVLDTTRLLEVLLKTFFDNFSKTLKTKDEVSNFIKFEKDNKVTDIYNHLTIGKGIGIYNKLKKVFPKNKYFENSKLISSFFNKINNVRGMISYGTFSREFKKKDLYELLDSLDVIFGAFGVEQEETEKEEQIETLDNKKDANLNSNKESSKYDYLINELSDLSEKEKVKVASNSNTPINILEKLAEEDIDRIKEALVLNPSTPTYVLEKLVSESGFGFKEHIASNPNTPISILENLANDNGFGVKGYLASNPNTPISILKKLAKDDAYGVKEGLASNPNTPINIFEMLAKDDDDSVRESVASNLNTPINILEMLAKDDDESVRESVASNPNTSLNILENLAKDDEDGVKIAVASNLNTPVNILKNLAKDDENGVKTAVASNPNTPMNVLEMLAKDNGFRVKATVASNPNTPINILKILAKDNGYGIKESVSSNPNTPLNLLEVLSEDDDHSVRESVALNPNTSIKILEGLIGKKDLYVKYMVYNRDDLTDSIKNKLNKYKSFFDLTSINNEEIDMSLLEVKLEDFLFEEFSRDIDPQIRSFVARNLNTPINILEELAEGQKVYYIRCSIASNPNTPLKILENLAKDENDIVINSVAENPSITLGILEDLSKHRLSKVRASVAKNPNVSIEILKKLKRDKTSTVKNAAKKALALRK